MCLDRLFNPVRSTPVYGLAVGPASIACPRNDYKISTIFRTLFAASTAVSTLAFILSGFNPVVGAITLASLVATVITFIVTSDSPVARVRQTYVAQDPPVTSTTYILDQRPNVYRAPPQPTVVLYTDPPPVQTYTHTTTYAPPAHPNPTNQRRVDNFVTAPAQPYVRSLHPQEPPAKQPLTRPNPPLHQPQVRELQPPRSSHERVGGDDRPSLPPQPQARLSAPSSAPSSTNASRRHDPVGREPDRQPSIFMPSVPPSSSGPRYHVGNDNPLYGPPTAQPHKPRERHIVGGADRPTAQPPSRSTARPGERYKVGEEEDK